jgi:hypothetical protein
MVLNIILVALGLAMLVPADAFARWAARRHDGRSADLKAGAQETYFEERRSLRAYPPYSKPVWWLLGGALIGLAVVRVFGH